MLSKKQKKNLSKTGKSFGKRKHWDKFIDEGWPLVFYAFRVLGLSPFWKLAFGMSGSAL